jgi:hypothetical protein
VFTPTGIGQTRIGGSFLATLAAGRKLRWLLEGN